MVAACLVFLIKNIMTDYAPKLKEILVTSDNATCFKMTPSIGWLVFLMKHHFPGINISRTTKQSQHGKDDIDALGADAKNSLRTACLYQTNSDEGEPIVFQNAKAAAEWLKTNWSDPFTARKDERTFIKDSEEYDAIKVIKFSLSVVLLFSFD